MTAQIKRNVDNIGADELQRPEIKLIQNTGGDAAKTAGAKPGDFFNVTSGEILSGGFEFVVLDFIVQRTYWGRDVIGDEPPMCSSLNAASYESVNGDICRNCERLCDNAGMLDAKTRREKCTKQYSFMGLLLPNLEPFQFRAAGTSSTAIQNLITRFRYNKACWNAERTAIDFHRFKVAITAREEKTKAGSAWVIKFGDISPFNDEAFEQELFLTSAQMLGQSVDLLPEGEVPAKQITAPTPAPETQTPKVNNVSPPAPPPPTPVENQPAKHAKSKGMNLDI